MMKKTKIAVAAITAAMLGATTGGLVACSDGDVPEGPGGVYTITLDENGGEFATGSVESVTTVGGKLTELPAAPDTPPQTDYIFVGWSLSANGDIITLDQLFTDNDVLYAIWAPPQSQTVYVITFNVGAGTLSGSTTAQTVNGKLSSLPTPTPTNSAMEFAGWYTQAEGKGDRVTASYTFSGATTNITLYAHYTAKAGTELSITLDLGDGSTTWPANPITFEKGEMVNLPGKSWISAPTGYEFKGWFTQAEGGDPITDGYFDSSFTAYAQYSVKESTEKTYLSVGNIKTDLYVNTENKVPNYIVEYWLGADDKVHLNKGDVVTLTIPAGKVMHKDAEVNVPALESFFVASSSYGVVGAEPKGEQFTQLEVTAPSGGDFIIYARYCEADEKTGSPECWVIEMQGGEQYTALKNTAYLVGGLNNWSLADGYELTEENDYTITVTLTAGAEFKVVMSDADGKLVWNTETDKDNQTDYTLVSEVATKKGDNYTVAKASEYTITFDKTAETVTVTEKGGSKPELKPGQKTTGTYTLGSGTPIALTNDFGNIGTGATTQDRQMKLAGVEIPANTKITFAITDEKYTLTSIYVQDDCQGITETLNSTVNQIYLTTDSKGGTYTIYLKHFNDSPAGQWNVWVGRTDSSELEKEKEEALAASASYTVSGGSAVALTNGYESINKDKEGLTKDRKFISAEVHIEKSKTITFSVTDSKTGYAVKNLWVKECAGLEESEKDITTNVVTVSKSGTFTFYLEHYSGNVDKYNLVAVFKPDSDEGGGGGGDNPDNPDTPAKATAATIGSTSHDLKSTSYTAAESNGYKDLELALENVQIAENTAVSFRYNNADVSFGWYQGDSPAVSATLTSGKTKSVKTLAAGKYSFYLQHYTAQNNEGEHWYLIAKLNVKQSGLTAATALTANDWYLTGDMCGNFGDLYTQYHLKQGNGQYEIEVDLPAYTTLKIVNGTKTKWVGGYKNNESIWIVDNALKEAGYLLNGDNLTVLKAGKYGLYYKDDVVYVAHIEEAVVTTLSLPIANGVTVTLKVTAPSSYEIAGVHVWNEGGAGTDWTTVSGSNVSGGTITGASAVSATGLKIILRTATEQTVDIDCGNVTNGQTITLTLDGSKDEQGHYNVTKK